MKLEPVICAQHHTVSAHCGKATTTDEPVAVWARRAERTGIWSTNTSTVKLPADVSHSAVGFGRAAVQRLAVGKRAVIRRGEPKRRVVRRREQRSIAGSAAGRGRRALSLAVGDDKPRIYQKKHAAPRQFDPVRIPWHHGVPGSTTVAARVPATPPQTHGARVSLSLTCLLYTSPSPRDRQKSRMPSSA